MCGAGVARSWYRGGSGGARESQLFFGYVITKMFSNILSDISFTTDEHYIIKIVRGDIVIRT